MLLHIAPDGAASLDTFGLVADEFWPYTTVVCDRIIEVNFSPDRDGSRRYEDLMAAALMFFGSADERGVSVPHERVPVMRNGWRAYRDNKVAFGFVPEGGGRPLYLGFYDNRVSVGLSVRPDRSAVETARTTKDWRMHDAVLMPW